QGPRDGLRIIEPRQPHARFAEELGAAALHVAQIVGVIDDAGQIGVFVVDAQRQDMRLALEAAETRGLTHRPDLPRTGRTAPDRDAARPGPDARTPRR